MFQGTGFRKCVSLNENGAHRLMFECLIPRWRICLGFAIPSLHLVVVSQVVNSQLLWQHHACLPVAKLLTVMVMDTNHLEP